MRFAWVFVALGLAQAALAQTVEVRSGDHPDFTRLTFALPQNAEWRLTQDGLRVALRIEGPPLAFSTTSVFARITRDRVSSLTTTGNDVILNLACDCRANAFAAGGGLLAVDIIDPNPQPADQVRPLARVLPPPVLTGALYRFPVGISVEPEFPRNTPERADSAPEPILPGIDLLPGVTATPPDEKLESTERLILSQDVLAQQIGRAATQGMLSMRRPLVDSESNSSSALDADAPSVLDEDTPAADPSDQISLTAATGVDIALSGLPSALAIQTGPVQCYSDAMVAVNEWGTEAGFYQDIAPLRRDLFGEFDVLDLPTLLGLAKAYLHYGFGREAREVLSMVEAPDEQVNLLRDLSHILDGETSPGASGLWRMAHCDGDPAMWSILVGGGGNDQLPAAIPAIERAFARLPKHLKPVLAMPLARRLTELGAEDAAQTLLLSLERGVPLAEEDKLQSQIALADLTGAKEEAETARMALAEAEGQQSPNAVVDLITTAWQQGSPPSPNLMDLVTSYATEMRRSPLGPDLRLARLRALALTQDFDGAYAVLEEIERRDGAAARHVGHADLLSRIATHGSDADVVRFGFTIPASIVAGLDAETGNLLAKRFLDLGFPQHAEMLLEPAARAPHASLRRVLRAQAVLDQGLIERAIVQLSGEDSPEADVLRARILEEKGDLPGAADLYRRLGQTEEADRLDWLAGMGGDARQGPRPVLDLPEASLDPGELAQARGLLDSSQIARDRVSAFLESQARVQN